MLAAGLWLLVRQQSTRTEWTALIDAATVTVALGIVAWELLIVHYTRDDSLSTAEKLVSIAYPLGDVLLLAVAARLLFGTAVRTFSYVLICLSLICLLIADPLYSLTTIRGDHGSGSAIDAGWILAYLLFGAAALHPSMRETGEPAPETVPKLTPLRMALLAAAALAAPVVLAFHPERTGVACTVVLVVLVGARLAGIVASNERALDRESQLRAAAATLVAATTRRGDPPRRSRDGASPSRARTSGATLVLDGRRRSPSAGEADGDAGDVFPLVVMGERRGELERLLARRASRARTAPRSRRSPTRSRSRSRPSPARARRPTPSAATSATSSRASSPRRSSRRCSRRPTARASAAGR